MLHMHILNITKANIAIKTQQQLSTPLPLIHKYNALPQQLIKHKQPMIIETFFLPLNRIIIILTEVVDHIIIFV